MILNELIAFSLLECIDLTLNFHLFLRYPLTHVVEGSYKFLQTLLLQSPLLNPWLPSVALSVAAELA